MPEIWHAGRVASGGIAIGTAFLLPAGQVVSSRKTDNPAAEAAALRSALAAAIDDIGALISASAGEAADVLEFQVAMLEDDSLGEPAFA
ncbi:MAG TPA: phosphoenolpyruvate-utilizing N-terminal domain-containing protein, partial [Terriglobales bacterium]|nr:phosphoenolpyruvate-utilizing N-terminal domain-containing protein [Terriglobales bacterium]